MSFSPKALALFLLLSFGFDFLVGLGDELGSLYGTPFLCISSVRLGVWVVLQHFLSKGIRYLGIGDLPFDSQHRVGVVWIEVPLELVVTRV